MSSVGLSSSIEKRNNNNNKNERAPVLVLPPPILILPPPVLRLSTESTPAELLIILTRVRAKPRVSWSRGETWDSHNRGNGESWGKKPVADTAATGPGDWTGKTRAALGQGVKERSGTNCSSVQNIACLFWWEGSAAPLQLSGDSRGCFLKHFFLRTQE